MTIKQVEFWDKDNKRWKGGIMVDNRYIICGCCGSVFECSDLKKEEIQPYNVWVDISDEIIGD